jgi:hypothetical protein
MKMMKKIQSQVKVEGIKKSSSPKKDEKLVTAGKSVKKKTGKFVSYLLLLLTALLLQI